MSACPPTPTHGRIPPLPEVVWALIYSYFEGLRDRCRLACTSRDLAQYRRHPLAVSHLGYPHLDLHLDQIVQRRGWVEDLKRIASPIGSLDCTSTEAHMAYPVLVQTFPETKRVVCEQPADESCFSICLPAKLDQLHLYLSEKPQVSLSVTLNTLHERVIHTLVSLSATLSFHDLLFLPPTLTRCNLRITEASTDTDDTFGGWCHFFGLPRLHSVTLQMFPNIMSHEDDLRRNIFSSGGIGGWNRLERNRLLLAPGLPLCQWRELTVYASRTSRHYTASPHPISSSSPPLPFLRRFVVNAYTRYTEDDWNHWVKIAPGVVDLTLDSCASHVLYDHSLRSLHAWSLERLCIPYQAKSPLLYLVTQPLPSSTPLPSPPPPSPAVTCTSSSNTTLSLFRSLSSLHVCWTPTVTLGTAGSPSVWHRVVSQLSSQLSSLYLHDTHLDSNAFDACYLEGFLVPTTSSSSYSTFEDSDDSDDSPRREKPTLPAYDGRHCEDILVSIACHLPQLRSLKCQSMRPSTSPHVWKALSSLCSLHTLRLFYRETDVSDTFYDRLAASLPHSVRYLATSMGGDNGPDSIRIIEQLVVCAGRQLLVWEINAAYWTKKKDIIVWMNERLVSTLCSLLIADDIAL